MQLDDELRQLAREAVDASSSADGVAIRELAARLSKLLEGDGDPRDEAWDELCEAAIGEHELVGNALNFVVCAACHVFNDATHEPTFGAHLRGARETLDEIRAGRTTG